MARTLINTPLWEYKQLFKHRALLVIVGIDKIYNMKKKLIRYVLLVVMLSYVLSSCSSRRYDPVPHGCGKKSKRYYHGEFLEYR